MFGNNKKIKECKSKVHQFMQKEVCNLNLDSDRNNEKSSYTARGLLPENL